MTVAELIKILQTMPQHVRVYMVGEYCAGEVDPEVTYTEACVTGNGPQPDQVNLFMIN